MGPAASGAARAASTAADGPSPRGAVCQLRGVSQAARPRNSAGRSRRRSDDQSRKAPMMLFLSLRRVGYQYIGGASPPKIIVHRTILGLKLPSETAASLPAAG